MSHYVTRAAKPLYVETPLWEPNSGLVPDLCVDGAKEINTGLLSMRGDPIYRVQDPIGFGREHER